MALRIFLSYSTVDNAVARVIWERLRASQHLVFYAEQNLPLAARIPPALEQHIKQCDVFIVLWSSAAKNSEWVSQEIGIAHGSQRVILPVILEKDLEPPGFIADRKYLPAYEEFQRALAFLDDALRAYAQNKQNREAALQKKQNDEAALLLLGIASIVLLAMASSG
jgi:hypothetical protein